MMPLEFLEPDKKIIYSTDYFSESYNHILYLKRALDDGSHKPKFYLSAASLINGEIIQQGHIYFYLDFDKKTSSFIGVKVLEEYRNMNIATLLIATWIDLCFNNGYDFLGTNPKQRKPFLIYLLKNYGFDIEDLALYRKRNDVIGIYRYQNLDDNNKLLLFKDKRHENIFINTNICKTDNYQIIQDTSDTIYLDEVIVPFQNATIQPIIYELRDYDKAKQKTKLVLKRHHK